jgi:lipopolysaccharide heptosyltransferase II
MKILIFTKNWLGDVLFEIPALRAIRENFLEARMVVLAPARCREILEAVPFLDEVRVFDERSSERSLVSKIRFLAWLGRERFDKVFLFHRSFTRAFLAWLGGIPERIGYRTGKRGWILTKSVDPPRQAMHQADYFLVLLKWAGLRVKFGAAYEFFYRAEDELKAKKILETKGLVPRAFAAFHIGANWEPKRWPASHFAELADLVSEAFSCPVVLTGSSEDEVIAQEVIEKAQTARPVSLCGKTSLGVLGAFYKQAAFVVSSDSGPMHIASGVGTPVVALFGPTSPKWTGPRGTGKKVVIQFVPEGSLVPWRGKGLPPPRWMEPILPEEVFERIDKENLWPQKKQTVSSSSP